MLFGGWSGTQKEVPPGVLFSLRDKVRGDGQADAKGGEDQTCDYCYTLRTADMRWIPCKFSGVPASTRYGHSATAVGPHLIVLGGWDGGKPLGDIVVLRDRSPNEAEQGAVLGGPPPMAEMPHGLGESPEGDDGYGGGWSGDVEGFQEGDAEGSFVG